MFHLGGQARDEGHGAPQEEENDDKEEEMDAEEGKADEAIDQVIFKKTFFFLNDLFLYLAIDTVFHPSGIFQNGMEISSKSIV